MKKIPILLVVIVLGLIIFLNRVEITNAVSNFVYQSPCDNPVTFSIGSIDARFNITRDTVIKDAAEAETIWNNAEGKNLLTYDANSSLKINLIYDVRQRLNSQINNLNSDLSQEDNQLKPEIQKYQQDAAAFKQKLADLNAEIDKWNKQGGAPPDVYKQLVAEQESLQQDAQKLNEEARALNQSTEQYNLEVNQLNQKVNTFNNVLQFKPEEGLYTQDSSGKNITIYFFSTHDDFVHTLAHEMGHAIGLGHIDDQKAIMFPQTNDVLTPSSADLSQLNSLCQKKNIIVVFFERFIRNLQTIVKNTSN